MSGQGDPIVKGTLTLKIANISTYMTKIGQRIQSPRQQVAGLGWHLRAFPSVVDNVIYLECRLVGENAFSWSAKMTATFKMVKNDGRLANEKRFVMRLFGNVNEALCDNLGFSLITREDLLSDANGYVVDDSVEIRVIFIPRDVYSSIFEECEAPAVDVKLVVGDRTFFVNKGYLSVVSSVFRDMFALTEAAAGEKETEELELKDLDADEFKEFLGIVYPIRYPITDANVISVFRLADRFGVQHIVTDCETHMLGVNSVRWFDKLKLTVDLRRDDLRNHLFARMTRDDIKAIKLAENKDQLGDEVLRAVFERHVGISLP
ncbi:Protein BATH-38 [Aphelenchoides avenae]|nr:Protein BATH-38 [Aphelenchus avenae]